MQKIIEEYGIMELLEVAVSRYGRWTGNRKFIWSGLKQALGMVCNEKIDNHKITPLLFQTVGYIKVQYFSTYQYTSFIFLNMMGIMRRKL